MKKNILILLPAMLLAISCDKVGLNSETGRTPMSIVAVSPQIGEGVKSQWIYDYDICWDENDKIYVKGAEAADTFTLTDGAGTSKGTFTQDGTASISGDVQAYYPASIYDADAQVAIWPEVQNGKIMFPLYCSKTISDGQNEVFDFKSLGGIVKVYFATEDKNIKIRSIELKDKTKPMSGEFTVDDDGQAIITSTENHGVSFFYNNVAVGGQTRYLNIFVPAGTYEQVTLLLVSAAGATCAVTLDEPLVVRQGEVTKIMASGSFVPHALNGKFSVSDNRQVTFSSGNLYYDGESFRFEEQQTDINLSWENGHVGHFLWSADANVACMCSYEDSAAAENDILFTNATADTPNEHFVVEGVGGQFRALSSDEWNYLFFSPKREGKHSFGIIIKYDEYFTLLYPDDYDGERIADKSTITVEKMCELLDKDVVFLRTAGRRYGTRIFGSEDGGNYWLSEANGASDAKRGYFGKYFVDHSDSDKRSYGYSLRLVHDVK